MSMIRLLPLLAIAAASAVLPGCGGRTEYRTVVVNPPPGQTVVIPSGGPAHYYYSYDYTRQCPSEPDC